jgi:predicted acylesterase/phospholipase RssA
MSQLAPLRTCRVGLALSGGSVRGLAHIGVIKALAEAGIRPAVITGSSAGSLIGAALASGRTWQDLAEMARSLFWPALLNGRRLESFCNSNLPDNFSSLHLPFAAVVTSLPENRPVTITTGNLSSAVSASCAMRLVRRPVKREGLRLKDGGISCVLPSIACRRLGAEVVVSSDVWELSSVLRSLGCRPDGRLTGRFYPDHYREALRHSKLLIQPDIPASGYLPTASAVERMIRVGEEAAVQALQDHTLKRAA